MLCATTLSVFHADWGFWGLGRYSCENVVGDCLLSFCGTAVLLGWCECRIDGECWSGGEKDGRLDMRSEFMFSWLLVGRIERDGFSGAYLFCASKLVGWS